MSENNVDEYLDQVRLHLDVLPDKESIIDELHNHIWDLANDLRSKTGDSIAVCFSMALGQMADPETLAKNFMEEDLPPKSLPDRITTRKILPEPRLTIKEINLIAVSAIALLLFLDLIIYIVNPIDTNILIVTKSGLLLVPILALIMYRRDMIEFNKDRNKLFALFQAKNDTPSKLLEDEHKFEPGIITKDDNSFMKLFGIHLSGFFGMMFNIMLIIVIVWATFMEPRLDSIFNQNWYYLGFTAAIVGISAEVLSNISTMIFGQIKQSRLVSAFESFVKVVANTILAIYYPFVFDIPTRVIVFGDNFSSFDGFAQFVLSMIAVHNLMKFIYHLIKYKKWNPRQHKSLIVVNTTN